MYWSVGRVTRGETCRGEPGCREDGCRVGEGTSPVGGLLTSPMEACEVREGPKRCELISFMLGGLLAART